MSTVVAVLVLCLAGSAAWIYLPRIASAERRASQLVASEKLAELHQEAVTEFVRNKDAPKELKVALLNICDLLDNDDAVSDVAKRLLEGQKGSFFRRHPVEDQLAALRLNSPELVDVFQYALTSGLCAAFLRVPDVAERFEAVMVAISKSTPAYVRNTVEEVPQRSTTAAGHMGPLVPA